MSQHSPPPAPSTSPSTLRTNPPPANVRVPTIKPYSAYVNQAVYVCGEPDSKTHLFSNNSTPPTPFPGIDSFGLWTLLAFLPCIFTDNSRALPFPKAVLGNDDWVLFHGGQRLYDSAMLRWLSNDSRGMINNDGVLMYGGLREVCGGGMRLRAIIGMLFGTTGR